jgi:HEAT repeat protein
MSRNTKKRVCVYGTLGVFALLLLLHPYAWQTVFGPRVRGLPLAYLQDEYRQAVASRGYRNSVTTKILMLVKVKSAAPVSLKELDNDDDMLPVVLSLVDDPEFSVRAAVARSLAKRPENTEACDGVMHLTEDASASVRRHAITALTTFGRGFSPALPRLQELMADDDLACGVTAAYGVCKISGQADTVAIAILQSALKTEDWNLGTLVCHHAAEKLGLLGKDNPLFLQILADGLGTDPNTRHRGVGYLREAGSAAIPVLVRLLADNHPKVREAAAASLGTIPSRATEAIPALAAVLDDANEMVRFEAAWALWRIDPKQFRQPARPAPNTNAK